MGKKNQAKPEVEEDGDVNMEELDGNVKSGKKGKKSRKKDFDEDDIARELEEMSMEVNGDAPPKQNKISDDDNVEQKNEKKSKKSSKDDDHSDGEEEIKTKVGGGFAALMGDMGDDEGEDDDHPKESKAKKGKEKQKVEKEDTNKLQKSKKDKQKKGKNKRRGNEDDDDIDELLAQIESEYRGEKKEVVVDKAKSEERDESSHSSKENNVENKEKKKDKGKKDKEINETKKEKQNDSKTRDLSSETKKDGKKKDAKVTDKTTKEDVKQEKLQQDVKKKVEKEETPPPDKKKSKTGKEEKKKEEEDPKPRKGKPTKKMLEAMKQLLAKQKEEEERLRKEEEEKQRQEEERIRQLEEQRRLEEERKERLKQQKKEKLKRMKEEGKILTAKQRLEQKRVKEMLEHLKAQGVAVPGVGEKLPTGGPTYKRQKRKKQEDKEESKDEVEETKMEEEKMQEEDQEATPTEEAKEEVQKEEEEEVVDAWDQLSESEDVEEESIKKEHGKIKGDKKENKAPNGKESEETESEGEDHDKQTEAEKKKERAVHRMEHRRTTNEKNKSDKRLRSPVVCVLGHVDHGKTKILDKLRRTNVQEGEVGGITQQIGATNVPFEAIKSQTRMVKDFEVDANRLPGLLIIDTPGHESFSNLRTRGSSLCDIAILVVDITQGLEPQTIESINLLKNKKTPFVVALNKVDRVFEWDSHPSKDIREIIKLQSEPSKNDFDRRTAEVIQSLNMQGLNAALFWENPDPRSYVSLVPTSAISGDGMGNLMALITAMCQKRLANRLMFSEELQCTVLEVKTIQGHGTTIDVILVNGRLKEGDTIILAGTEGPIVTQIRSLLIPKPMKEIRVKGQYDELKVVEAALGVKVAARDLEKSIAGLNLQVAHHEDEVEILKEEVDKEFKTAMRSIKVKDKGVYVQASTLGALEALLEFFKANKVPYAGIRVGPVVKRDVMKAAAMLEHDPMYAVILAFDVKVERDAQELADKEGIKIFSEETIYHLGDRYVEYIKEYKKKKQDEFRHVAVFPCKLKIIPDAIFNKRDPIVLGVTVDSGILRTGTPLCVPSKEFVEIGVVTSLEFDHKVVEIAKKGVNVCMKVEPVPGHTPKLFGRHFEAEDMLVSKITRESIDACKQYFRDDLGKTEWKLMAELKKQFGIL